MCATLVQDGTWPARRKVSNQLTPCNPPTHIRRSLYSALAAPIQDTNASHSLVLNVNRGPSGSFESRTHTSPPTQATSTQFPFEADRELFNHCTFSTYPLTESNRRPAVCGTAALPA